MLSNRIFLYAKLNITENIFDRINKKWLLYSEFISAFLAIPISFFACFMLFVSLSQYINTILSCVISSCFCFVYLKISLIYMDVYSKTIRLLKN